MLETEITIAEAKALLSMMIDAGDPVMLWGPPGIGKSQIVHQIGDETSRKVIEFRANIREPVDVRGIPVPDLSSGTTRWLVPDELPRVDRDGERGILFLDEINTATLQMQAVLFGLVLERRLGDYTLPDGWVIVAAGNRVSDRAAATRMPTALRNRFAHLFIKPDVDAWTSWANLNLVAPEMIAFVRLRRELIHMMPKGDENAFPTPRSLTRCAKYVNAPKHRLRLFAAHVGDAVAAEIDGFIDLYRTFGSLDEVIADPQNAPLPQDASMRFAVCTGLGRIATRKNIEAIITYTKRLPQRDHQILAVTDATERDPSIRNTPAYSKWAVDNQDITLQAA